MFFKKQPQEIRIDKMNSMDEYIKWFEGEICPHFEVPYEVVFDNDAAVTVVDSDAVLFDLKPVQTAKKIYANSAVCRVRITERDLDRNFISKTMGKMKKLLEDKGFPIITFKRPDGHYYLVMLENDPKGYELRAVGYSAEVEV